MAKQHRMALLTVACFATAIEYYIWQHDFVMLAALVIMNIGCVLTLAKRTTAAYRFLENK